MSDRTVGACLALADQIRMLRYPNRRHLNQSDAGDGRWGYSKRMRLAGVGGIAATVTLKQDRPVLPSQSAHFAYKPDPPACWRASPKRTTQEKAATRHFRSVRNPPRRSDHPLQGSRRSFVTVGRTSADRNGAENSEEGQDHNPCPIQHRKHCLNNCLVPVRHA